MRVSCLPVSFFAQMLGGKMSVREWAHLAARAGLDAIDLSGMMIANHTPVYLRKLKSDIESEGLPVVMIATYPDFSHPDRMQRQRELDYLECDIAAASFLEARYVRIVAGQAHPTTPLKQGVSWVLENFERAAETADKYGLQLVFENHSKPGAWDYVDFSHPTELFLEISEAIRDTAIGIHFDTANTLVYGDDALEVLEKVVASVVTIHAADTAQRGRLEPVPLGQGIVPFKEIFQLLKRNNFDGWICIEEASNTGETAVRRATDFVRETWEKA